MAEPKKKLTRARRDKRKAGHKYILPSLSICPKCKTSRPNYTVCPVCGFYKDKIVIKKEEKKK
jgi:large subunit ribosomal protein L32